MRALSWPVVLAVIAMLLVFAACGGGDDDDNDDADDSGGQTTSTQVADSAQATVAAALSTASALIPDSGNTDGINACEMLTPEEVGEAVGLEAGEGQEGFVLGECTWNVGDPELSYTVTLTFSSLNDYALFKGDTPEEISGLGDEAYWGSTYTLGVRRGEQAFHLQVVTLRDSDKDAAVQLARLVLERM